MKIGKLLLCSFCSVLLLFSCSDDDDIAPEFEPEGEYINGFFVLNEGLDTTGTVTYISKNLQKVEQHIFNTVNSEDTIGFAPRSMFFDDQNAYIISRDTSLITVMDRYSFELVGRIGSALSNPMYGIVQNGKAYVTNLGNRDSNEDDFLAVINTANLQIEKKIVVGDYAEYITEDSGLLYIKNVVSDSGSKISVFDPTSDSIIRTITAKRGYNSFEILGNTIYVISAGGLQKIDKATGAVRSETIFSTIHAGASNIDIEDETVYFTAGTSVYTLPLVTTEGPGEAILSYQSNSENGTMSAFEVKNDRIFIADGGDLNSEGFIEVYTMEGEFVQQIPVGVKPNGFYFNE
ncbi:quinoprotein amine dehydrogenase [Zunongwangia sp. F260]|uniref:Quinoprotein amine dehydrogenase n=1 Tax=Autumnicola lenta TaxID=3075593 RepID=A0ABU3CPJ3_9FLAO|nr:quinoprotein amine dehydrogenase [Zunongwangia sp. F260]MDT0648270.1 quinoprotein amine dehydrogenase [Zunongwangia sp. F260]